jgi:hypothetical protein
MGVTNFSTCYVQGAFSDFVSDPQLQGVYDYNKLV